MSETEKPLTLSQFVEFYSKMIEPRFAAIENEVKEFRQEFREFKSDTVSKFDDLYKKF